jgi:HAD superfamily hydrolase (TIGR01549 family)
VGTAAILDVDGTLVDSNYQHSLAWYRAFREEGITIPIWRIHRHIGMGGDQLVPALAGGDLDPAVQRAIRDAEKRQYGELIDEVVPFEGARELIEELKRREHAVVLASSAKEEEIERYVDLIEARGAVDAWTTSADVDATKPAPDLVAAALQKAGELSAVMVGDTSWDVEAAERAEVKTVAVLTGGFGEAELREAGAVAVFDSLVALREGLDETPLR